MAGVGGAVALPLRSVAEEFGVLVDDANDGFESDVDMESSPLEARAARRLCKPAVFYCTLTSIFLYYSLSITLEPHLRVTIMFLSILYNVSYTFIMY